MNQGFITQSLAECVLEMIVCAGGCCEEWTRDGVQFCAYRDHEIYDEVHGRIERGIDSSAQIHKASINTNRQGHLNDIMCL